MEDLKKGDIITYGDGLIRRVVMARLEDLIWTQELLPHDAKGPVSTATEISDLATYGFTKEDS